MELQTLPQNAEEVIELLPEEVEVEIFYSGDGTDCRTGVRRIRRDDLFAGERLHDELQQLVAAGFNDKPDHNAKDIDGSPVRHIQVTLWGSWEAYPHGDDSAHVYSPSGLRVAVFQDTPDRGTAPRFAIKVWCAGTSSTRNTSKSASSQE